MPLLLLPLAPAVAAVGVVACRGRPFAAAVVGVAGLIVTLALGVWAAIAAPSATYAWSEAIELRFAVTDFGRVMVVLVPLVAAPILSYAAATEDEGRTRLLALMTAFVAAMLVLVIAVDFVSLLIAWELIGAMSWALIGHGWRDPDNPRAAAQAFLTTRLGDLGLYAAAGALFAASGSFRFDAVGAIPSPWSDVVAAGILLAAAAKSAQVPFSPWLFAAMAGPTPVSALLHSATLVSAGAYLLIRLSPMLVNVGWFLPAIVTIGVVTTIAGGIVATVQTHAKRTLAASTSAQYGLMFVAVGAGFPAAAGAQLVTHAAFKSLLFLGAGTAIHATGTGLLGRFGLGRALPTIGALSAVGALALAAVPPLGGAWSKEQVVAGALERSPWLGIAVLAAGFLSAAYATRYQLLAFGSGDASDPLARATALRVGRSGRAETASMAVLALVTVGLSVLWVPGVGRVFGEVTASSLPAASIQETVPTVALVLLGGAAAVRLRRGGRLVDLGLRPARQRALEAWLGLPTATSAIVVRPVLALSGALRSFDDRVIDAGVRASGRVAHLASEVFSHRIELTIDGTVTRIAEATQRMAAGSRRADDAGIDAAVEAAGRGVGIAGHQSRRLQTGQSHQYYVIVGVGLAAIVAVLAVAR